LERDIGPRGASLLSEKIHEPRQLNDVFRRQNCGNQIGLRRGVNFIQMALRFGQTHKLLDALVEGDTITDQIGARTERGADALTVEGWPFSKLCGGAEINFGIGHAGIQARDTAQGNARLLALQLPDQSCGRQFGF